MEMEALASKSEKLYKAKVSYFERPISSNHGYDYNIVSAVNPYDFTVTINDSVGAKFEEKLKTLLNQHQNALDKEQQGSNFKDARIDSKLFYTGMPVLVKGAGFTGSNNKTLTRGEVLDVDGINLKLVLVDLGGIITKSKDDVLPVPIDILRVPKLGIPCKIGQIRPSKGSSWPNDRDYKSDFSGSESQVITFLDYYPDAKSYEAIVEVDKVNVAVRYFHLDVAVPIPLISHDREIMEASYPVYDYSPWIGLKVIVFGVQVMWDDDGSRLKCVLQMDPEVVNGIQQKIVDYIGQTPQNVLKAPFNKKCGSPCLALFGDEYFRATIVKNEENGNVVVDYVDYGERQTVPSSEVLKIPQELLKYSEGAVVCQITDFLATDFKDFDKLKEMVESKDLYAVIDACDTEIFGRELLVSLFQPIDFFGTDNPFADLFKITERPAVVKEILQFMEELPDEWCRLLLTCEIPEPTKFHPGATISVINSWDSIYIQVSDSIEKSKVLCTEMTHFYKNGGCSDGARADFAKKSLTGKYVAAKQEEDEDDSWYRAKVLAEQDGMLELLYVDYGNTERVNKNDVFPLHKYFAKDSLMALEVAVKY